MKTMLITQFGRAVSEIPGALVHSLMAVQQFFSVSGCNNNNYVIHVKYWWTESYTSLCNNYYSMHLIYLHVATRFMSYIAMLLVFFLFIMYTNVKYKQMWGLQDHLLLLHMLLEYTWFLKIGLNVHTTEELIGMELININVTFWK